MQKRLKPIWTWVSILVSQAGSATTAAAVTTADEVTEVVTTDYLSTLPKADFDGASYVIAAQSTEQRPNLPGEEENGEVLNDALIRRNREVADLYNVTIENLIYAGKKDDDVLLTKKEVMVRLGVSSTTL